MNWLMRTAVILAVLVGAGALIHLLMQKPPQVEDVPIPEVVRAPPRKHAEPGVRVKPQQGGRYAGRVVDVGGQPVASAHVLLVAYNPGDPKAMQRYAEELSKNAGRPDPALIPRIGDYRIDGEKITDRDGVFTVTASETAYVTHIVAYRQGFFPTIEDVQVFPRTPAGHRERVVIVLEAAGRVIGKVVDHKTNEPIPHARIDINLQNPTRPPPEIKDGQEVATRSQTGKPVPLSQFSMLQSFVTEHLGERVWGLTFQGGTSLVLKSDENGNFELGPLGPTVQVEFIVTHPDYKWSDLDRVGSKKAPRRTIVPAGETVYKELRLEPGYEIAGEVIVRGTNEKVKGALIEVRSISAYARHWWYRHKVRRTRTDDQGRFRVAGLSFGAQTVMVKHPSFGVEYQHGVQHGEKNLLVYVKPFGAFVGRVIGLGARPPGGRVEIFFEAPEKNPKRARMIRKKATLTATDQFEVNQIQPGLYRVWIRAGKMTSQPQEVEIESLGIAQADFELGGGGALELNFFAKGMPAVDPVTVSLFRVGEEGERSLGMMVTREGTLEVDGLVPGTYRLRARAAGFAPKDLADIAVRADRVERVPPIELQAMAQLEFSTILDENRRPYAATRGAVFLDVIPKGKAARRIHSPTLPVSLPPGVYTVRAEAKDAGLRFEKTVDLTGGAKTRVEVVMRPTK